jgi:hypothetical protein
MARKSALMLFTILICPSFSKWNLIQVGPLEELHAILHAVSCLLAETTNALQVFPLLKSLTI